MEERKTRPLFYRGTHSRRLCRRRSAVKSYYFSIARMSLPRALGEALLQYLCVNGGGGGIKKRSRFVYIYYIYIHIIYINVSVSLRSRRKKSQRNYHQRRRV